MDIGIYFDKADKELHLSPIDLIQSLNDKEITICIPNWLGHQKAIKSIKNVQFLPPDEFYKIKNHFVFLNCEFLFSPWMTQKNICFVLDSFPEKLSEVHSYYLEKQENISQNMGIDEISIITHFYKKLQPPFDNLFTRPTPKFRNCFIINDALVNYLSDMEFDHQQDMAIAYTTTADQKPTYERLANANISPADSLSSFRQALLAKNIYIEPDAYDLALLVKVFVDLAFHDMSYFTHNTDLQKIFSLGTI